VLFAKNYHKQPVLVETTACQIWRVLLRHSVLKWRRLDHKMQRRFSTILT